MRNADHSSPRGAREQAASSWGGAPVTEEEWLACNDSRPMLKVVGNWVRADHRKLRLFACSCARLVWDDIPDESLRKGIEVSERFADKQADESELATCANVSRQAAQGIRATSNPGRWWAHGSPAIRAADIASGAVAESA